MNKTRKNASRFNLKEKNSRFIKQKSWKSRIESNVCKDKIDEIDIDVDNENWKHILNEMSSYECVSQAYYHVKLN